MREKPWDSSFTMRSTWTRAPLLAVGLLTMFWSALLGLARLGWSLPVPRAEEVLWHGPLFIGGFFGTLITLERAVSVATRWAYAGPLLAAGGAVLLGAGWPGAAAWAITGASVVLFAGGVVIAARRNALAPVVGALGAGAWLGGNLLWLAGRPVYQVVYWWMAFLVLTVAGTRLARTPSTAMAGATAVTVAIVPLAAGVLLSVNSPDPGARLTGTGLLLTAAVLTRRHGISKVLPPSGFERYMGSAVLAAHAWLAAGGLMAIIFGGVTIGPRYDAVLHAIFLGFVMSMVFAHAPLMFPAILGLAVPFRPAFYAHLALLHVSLGFRVAGDLVTGLDPLRAWGGLLNAVALLLFVANTARSVVLATRGR